MLGTTDKHSHTLQSEQNFLKKGCTFTLRKKTTIMLSDTPKNTHKIWNRHLLKVEVLRRKKIHIYPQIKKSPYPTPLFFEKGGEGGAIHTHTLVSSLILNPFHFLSLFRTQHFNLYK